MNNTIPHSTGTNTTTTDKTNDFTQYNKFEILATNDSQKREIYRQDQTMDIDDNSHRDDDNLEDGDYEEEQSYSDFSFKDEQHMENNNMNFTNNSIIDEQTTIEDRRGSSAVSKGSAAVSTSNYKIKNYIIIKEVAITNLRH